jgi:hypothetical protein
MPTITDDQLDAYIKDHRDLAELRSEVSGLEMLLKAAARQGFTNTDQEDAIYFALEKVTKEPRAVLKLTLHVNPKGFSRG